MERLQQLWTGFGMVVVGAVLVLLALKVVWNFGSPYVLIRRALKQQRDHFPSMSMLPVVDLFLLVVAILIAIGTFQDGIFRATCVAAYGTAAVVTSYLHFAIVEFLFVRLRATFFPRR